VAQFPLHLVERIDARLSEEAGEREARRRRLRFLSALRLVLHVGLVHEVGRNPPAAFDCLLGSARGLVGCVILPIRRPFDPGSHPDAPMAPCPRMQPLLKHLSDRGRVCPALKATVWPRKRRARAGNLPDASVLVLAHKYELRTRVCQACNTRYCASLL